MKYVIKYGEFGFDVIATVLTGRIFATKQKLKKFAKFLGSADVEQMLADRDSKWIPFLLVQFPFFVQLDTSAITDKNAQSWFKFKSEQYREFSVRAVHVKT